MMICMMMCSIIVFFFLFIAQMISRVDLSEPNPSCGRDRNFRRIVSRKEKLKHQKV